jgi:CHAT domain/WD domain, G-beta repeat
MGGEDGEREASNVIEVAIGPGRSAGGFRVEVVSSPAGEATAETSLDAGGLLARRPDLQRAVLASAVSTRQIPTSEEQAIREVGRALHAALLGTGPITARYAASAALAAERGETLRIVLRIDSPQLATLPWEAMYDEEAGSYVCRRHQLVRHVPVAAVRPPLRVELPLRVLGVLSAPRGLSSLDADLEREYLDRALAGLTRQGLAEITWTSSATWGALHEMLMSGPWHVVHFIGHGGFDPERDEGVLALEHEDARPHMISASQFADLLRQAQPMPRLVVLNACSTAAASVGDLFAGTASALARSEIPAVAAMQYAVSDNAAIAFTRGFYTALAHGRGIDEATSAGRVAILGTGSHTLEWVTPVLYLGSHGDLRGHSAHLFALTPAKMQAGASAPTRYPAGQPPQTVVPDHAPGSVRPEPGDSSILTGSPHDSVRALRDEDVPEEYGRGLVALYTERWDEAVQAFLAVTAGGRKYRDSDARLEQARRGQSIPELYAAACQAADAGQWGNALVQFEAVEAAEPAYRDVPARLEQARREHVRAEVADLHHAGRWEDVLKAGERLQALSPGDPDPDGLVASASVELVAADHTRMLGQTYRRALDYIAVDEWVAALMDLTIIQRTDPGYEHTAQLADRARRELARTRPRINHPATVISRGTAHWFTEFALSPDGTQLALAMNDDMCAVVTDLDGHEKFRLRHNRSKDKYSFISSVAFDPSGKRVLTSGPDNTARIWDATSGTQLLVLAHDEWVRDAVFSPSGQTIATVGRRDTSVLIWDASSGNQIDRIPHGRPERYMSNAASVAFSPDGLRIAAAHWEAACVWDITQASEMLALHHRGMSVRQVSFSLNGRMLATACHDKMARVWDAVSGSIFLELAHPENVDSVAFSPDGRMLASAAGGAALIWDATTGDQLFSSSSASTSRVAFSRDGQYLAALSSNLFRLWRIHD